MSGSQGANVIGSGSDSILLNMSGETAAGIAPQFSVNVDGQQIGPRQSTSATKGSPEAFEFRGEFGPGPHDVVVTFANNFVGMGTTQDRNLFVESVAYNGTTVSNGVTPIYTGPLFPPNGDKVYSGNASFQVNDTTAANGTSPTTTPAPVTIGAGADVLVLKMAEDPYEGHAQFTVSVDGKQVGDAQTTTANVSEGQAQTFYVKGDFGPGAHTVTVDFLNDHIGAFYPAGTPGLPPGQWAVDTTDRNLYIMDIKLNGGSSPASLPWELSSSGAFSWNVTPGSGAAPVPETVLVTPDTTQVNPATVGGPTPSIPADMTFIPPQTVSGIPANETIISPQPNTTLAETVAGTPVPTPTTDATIANSFTQATTNNEGGSTAHYTWANTDHISGTYHQQTG